jgi:arylsulfatase A-like enzyme
MTIDVLPTVADLLDAELPPHPIDGKSILPLLQGEPGARSPHEALFFYYRRNDLEAMRSGRWKLHFPHRFRSMEGREPGRDGTPGKYDHDRRTGLELYDLEADIGETTDLADEHPEVVARLQKLANAMRAELGDALTDVEPTARREPDRIKSAPEVQ